MRKTYPPGDLDRALALEEYLEVGLQGLADEAVEEGWTDSEIDAALLGLIRARLMIRTTNSETAGAIIRRQQA